MHIENHAEVDRLTQSMDNDSFQHWHSWTLKDLQNFWVRLQHFLAHKNILFTEAFHHVVRYLIRIYYTGRLRKSKSLKAFNQSPWPRSGDCIAHHVQRKHLRIKGEILPFCTPRDFAHCLWIFMLHAVNLHVSSSNLDEEHSIRFTYFPGLYRALLESFLKGKLEFFLKKGHSRKQVIF